MEVEERIIPRFLVSIIKEWNGHLLKCVSFGKGAGFGCATFSMLSGWRHLPRTRQYAKCFIYSTSTAQIRSEALEVMHLQVLDHVPPGLGFEPRLPLQGFVTLRSTGH